jgi:hypothetical protein
MRAFSIISALGIAMVPASGVVEPLRIPFRVPSLPPVHLEVATPTLLLAPPPSLRFVSPLLLLGGCIVIEEGQLSHPVDGLIDLFGSAENYGSAVSADRVEIIVLKGRIKGSADVSSYDEVAGFTLSDEDAATLRATLTCDATYDWREEFLDDPDEAPTYSFRVKLRSAKQEVVVDLSMSRGIARVAQNGREVAKQRFEFGYETVASLLDRLFPRGVEKKG